jgi:lipopolysaccharide/colanic/teichoic acid biosynthesis glycosyltransferase
LRTCRIVHDPAARWQWHACVDYRQCVARSARVLAAGALSRSGDVYGDCHSEHSCEPAFGSCDHPAEAPVQRIVKRLLDVIVASVLLVVMLPILFVTAVAIKLDSPGPVHISQTRVGRGGRLFKMLKFRTMIPERRLRTHGPPPGMAERRKRHKSAADPRVTRVGRFLRRTCLDEVPQFWNVLLGDMSLVGPRPELPEIVARYASWQHGRHAVVPGITGWWQVNRSPDRLMHEDTELDLYYVENWSLRLDMLILVRTVNVVIRGLGAF